MAAGDADGAETRVSAVTEAEADAADEGERDEDSEHGGGAERDFAIGRVCGVVVEGVVSAEVFVPRGHGCVSGQGQTSDASRLE